MDKPMASMKMNSANLPPDLIQDGDTFTVIALSTRTAEAVAPTEMLPGFWISGSPPCRLDAHWEGWLGSLRMDEIRAANLFLLIRAQSVSPSPVAIFNIDHETQAQNNRAWHMFCGLMLADRFGVRRRPVVLSGYRSAGAVTVRQLNPLDAPCHSDPSHVLDSGSIQTGAVIGKALEDYPWGDTWRFNRTLHLYFSTRATQDWLDRLHGYTRCLEGLTVPPNRGGTGKNFVTRVSLFAGEGHQDIFEEIYKIRGKVEHLHENIYLEKFDRNLRLDLVRKVGMVEFIARTALVRVLTSPSLHGHFATTKAAEAFWTLPIEEQRRLWGDPVNPDDGMDGIRDSDFTREMLGA